MDQSCTDHLPRLNPYCDRALGAAAILCQSRGHGLISIEHWLLKLLEQCEGDLPLIARCCEWDIEAIWCGLLEHLDSLPCSVQSEPQLCVRLQQLIKNAWLKASLDSNPDNLRSAHLLGALLETPELLATEAARPLLRICDSQLQALSGMLDLYSAERPGVCP